MLYETYGIGTEVKAGGQARSPIAVDFPAVLRIQLEKLATQSTEPLQPERMIKKLGSGSTIISASFSILVFVFDLQNSTTFFF